MKLTSEQLEKLSPERRVLLQKMLAERTGARGASPAAPDVPRRRGGGPAPLSFAQQRLWFIQQLDPRSTAYNMPAGMRLRGPLDTAALRRALGEIVRRHEALRTVFAVPPEGEPVQVVRPPAPVPLPAVDLSGLRPEGRERELSRHARGESLHPFDLERGPLLRAALLRLEGADHAVLFTLHHIVCDGWSMGVLVREVSELYAAFAEGRPSPLPELPVQYPDYAVWQREHVSGRRLAEQLEFWKRRLAGAPPLLELPTDRPRPAVEDSAGARCSFRLSPELTAAAHALARREGATPFMALLAALQLVLGRWSGQDDVVVGSPVAGRTRVDLEGLIGFFVNTLTMRADLSGDPSARGLLARVRATVLEAQSNQDLPFERLVEEVSPERTLAHSPVFQVLLALQNVDSGSLRLGAALEAEPLPVAFTTAKFDLNWSLEEFPGGMGGAVSYRSSLWDGATVARMVDHLRAVLAGMAAHPELPVSRIELLAPGEREQVLRAWNATEADYPTEGGLAGLFEAQAARTPAAEALVFGRERLTYAELDRRAAALAARLRALGVGTDARVGLCLERSPEMIVGVLGILKAGAAYVPIDPAYPEDRVAYMLEDAGISVLLTQERLVARLPATGAGVVMLDGGDVPSAAIQPPYPPGPPPPASGGKGENDDGAGAVLPSLACGGGAGGGGPAVSPESLAYVIYTSGSTGRPKGVAMQQRPLLNLLAWQRRDWRAPGPAVTLQFATISFDASFHEMFSCWAEGGTLVVAPEEARRDPAAVLELLEREGVERLFLPFVALQHLAEEALERGAFPRRLREVQTAGEQLRVTDAIRAWLGGLGIPLHNHYGPSETHVATRLTLDGDPAGWPLLPSIGGPVANTCCYVLDAELRPAPVGVPGELYLAGDCVARGYLGRPCLTAERFLPDAYGRGPGARMYRSGDRARWTAAGELEFLGRVDQQVKVRGFRIEPGEVEAALEAHPAVREAVVVARDGGAGGRRLVGYVVAEEGAGPPAAAELRAWVAARLPEYMVPAAFVALDALPLTPSGKTDRRALPEPDAPGAAAGPVPPRTVFEEIVVEVWRKVLKTDRVGVFDDFFALGGHSLLAARVVARLREETGEEVPLRAMFDAPTAAALAAYLERRLMEDEEFAGEAGWTSPDPGDG
ncbi:MAG: amino acid adenylation domain-containing protein [Gemmatimonadota bacterium]